MQVPFLPGGGGRVPKILAVSSKFTVLGAVTILFCVFGFFLLGRCFVYVGVVCGGPLGCAPFVVAPDVTNRGLVLQSSH